MHTLLRKPSFFGEAVRTMIMGIHFRRALLMYDHTVGDPFRACDERQGKRAAPGKPPQPLRSRRAYLQEYPTRTFVPSGPTMTPRPL